MVLVTGGTGFLGAYILKYLIESGHSVRAIRRSAKLPFYIPSHILEQVEWVEGDVLDVVSLDDAMQGIDSVIHSAAVVSFSRSGHKRMYSVNIEGTANVVNAALDNGVKRFLHVSSVAALGRTSKTETVTENRKWEEGRSNTHYAITKHHAEMHAWRGFAEGLDGAIINPSTLLGFGDWHTSSSAIFRNVYNEFPWYSNGVNGFVGVEDTAEAAVRLLFSSVNHKRFIVNGENWSFRQLFNTIAENLHKKPPSKEATPVLGSIAWRMEAIRSLFTGSKPLLTRETARVAQSRTSFDNSAILKVLPSFRFTPLQDVIKKASGQYLEAVATGKLTR